MNLFRRIKNSEWLVPAALLFLSLIPVIAGSFRMTQLSKGVVVPETERFYSSLVPMFIHIISATIFSVIGAFQFSSAFRKRMPKFHRIAGRILVIAGFGVAISGLWMTLIYKWAPLDGVVVYVARLITGALMTYFVFMGVDAIRRRKFFEHGDWMIRAYAIGMGAATQVFTHIPIIIFPNAQNETTRAICMVSAWVINMAVAEWIIRKPKLSLSTNNNAYLKGA